MPALGLFESNSDVGPVLRAGSVQYSPAPRTYTVSGAGENMWGKSDAFQYVWKKVSGDVSLSADVSFIGQGKNPHRKACLVIRQTLDADSAYADAALHGDGLTSLQYRLEKGDITRQVESWIKAPARLKIIKQGDYVTIFVSKNGQPLQPGGGSIRLKFQDPFYIGLAVCSHENDFTEQAVFSNVELITTASSAKPVLYSSLETLSLSSPADRRSIYVTSDHIEAPNWTRDGKSLIFNSSGRLYKIDAKGGTPQAIDTGFAIRNNNDHGISFDGKTLAISDQSQGDHKSVIYTLPLEGGTPTRVTPLAPSYWHGWSPDGKTLTYCAERNGSFDIYTIPVTGGQEKRLTQNAAHNDGPEFSPDGKFIYFNSSRTGSMQIWRMLADGGSPEQITRDDHTNWFPHLSPDGKFMVYLAYEPGVEGHPANKNVSLRLMTLADKTTKVLVHFFGGQGTINVPSWSPDSKQFAFVTYQLIS